MNIVEIMVIAEILVFESYHSLSYRSDGPVVERLPHNQ